MQHPSSFTPITEFITLSVDPNYSNGKQTKSKTPFLTGWKVYLIRHLMWWNIGWIALKLFGKPRPALQMIKRLKEIKNQYRDPDRILKYAYTGNRFYVNLNTPGWPSRAFNRFIKHQFLKYSDGESPGIHTLIMAVTKKCGFRCEHCFEWNQLNQPESLSREQLLGIVTRFAELGVAQLQFSGGEPLNRFDDLKYILEKAPPGIDYWLYTSGYLLTEKKAAQLRKLGMTGVIISIDHYIPEEHDRFRGVQNAFSRAMAAIGNAQKHGLTVALSCCVTRALCNRDHLNTYMEMARSKGVSFVQFLEPKAVGHYEGRDVLLRPEHIRILEDFFEFFTHAPYSKDYPILTYHGYHSRRMGCSGSGKDYVYVDTNGLIQSCPFCTEKWFSAMDDDLKTKLMELKSRGCETY